MIKIKLKLNKYVFNIINFNKDKNIIINKNIFLIPFFLTIIISNLFIHLIAFMFLSSKYDRFKLFNAFINGRQLFILNLGIV